MKTVIYNLSFEFKKRIRKYFSFTNKETNGFLVLTILIPFIFLLHKLPQNEQIAILQDKEKLDSLLALFEIREEPPLPVVAAPKPCSSFNPNEMAKSEWIAFGLSEKIAERILHYQSKGGSFRKKDDVQKIYGFPQSIYMAISECITIPESLSNKPKFAQRFYARNADSARTEKADEEQRSYPKKKVIYLNINTATDTMLQQVKGIGQVLSERIIKYRDALGGFESIAETKQVYGLDSLTLLKLQHSIFVDSGFVRNSININTVDEETMRKHPFIDYKLARLIIAYRQQHGHFKSDSELYKIYGIEKDKMEALSKYVKIE